MSGRQANLEALKVKTFAPDVVEAMMRYPGKGSVRELKNVVERLRIMTAKDAIEKKDLPA